MPYRIPAAWTRLAWLSTVLMALASWVGVFVEGVYAKEAPSWATQGVGQDLANLFVVLPVMAGAALLAGRGSFRAVLVLVGTLLYVVYSYVLYAFFMHFGPWFPVYVATLGCAFFALAGLAAHLVRDDLSAWFGARVPVRTPSAFLMIVGVTFAMLWLGEIVPALVAGRAPASVEDVGLPVNPVHVLDLALVLPGMMATSVMLGRRRPAGYLFTVPMLVFSAVMGVAIEAMAAMMALRDIAVPPPMIVVVAGVTLGSLALVVLFLRRVGDGA